MAQNVTNTYTYVFRQMYIELIVKNLHTVLYVFYCCLLCVEVLHGWSRCFSIIVQVYHPATERKYSKCKGVCHVLQL